MRFRDLAYETTAALDANRIRSALTILGIVIGIGSVITMTSLIGGIRQSVMGSMGLNAARTVTMFVDNWTITAEDLTEIQETLPEYECLIPVNVMNATMVTDKVSKSLTINGTYPQYVDIASPKIEQGRFFSEDDLKRGNTVVVLDSVAVRTFFGKENAPVVGKTVLISGTEYPIVGVVHGTAYDAKSTGEAFVPFSTFCMRISGDWSVGNVRGLAYEGTDMDALDAATVEKVAEHFNIGEESIDDISFFTEKSYIDQSEALMVQFEMIMVVVSSISLLVGGIGIMNMMLTNVTERIREIGLRKALGARRGDITKQFLLESVCLCISGGIIGIALGYAGAYVMSTLAGSALQNVMSQGMETAPIRPIIDIRAVIAAAVVCVFIGTAFGYYPARRAASLDPVEALHYQ